MAAASGNTTPRGKGRPRSFDKDAALLKALDIFWRRGYEPASISELCSAMGINAPSLYAAFGNKAGLFLEAVAFYEEKYWQEPSRRFLEEKNFYLAVHDFFAEAARILLSPDTPCGCMVVLAAVNISEEETDIIQDLRKRRLETRDMFARKIRQAVDEGQLPADTSPESLACAFNTFLEGMSLQAQSGMSVKEMEAMASYAVRMLPKWRKHLKQLPDSSE
ncbi:TetR/AcrR family transcriptional regulator [Mailhella massiliensis]|uniref:TetR/AcrR family transcriptional regulator n=1 Tax=Mailhella massiliensis TaxID=1903261 RepID=UPI0023F30586|nr:TetR/AcrR family transcriptional regulator [Mailhella massiliensis]